MNPVPMSSRALGGVALLVMLAACGGASTPPPEVATDPALTASRPGELVSYVQGKLRARQVQRQQAGGALVDSAPATSMPLPSAGVAAPPPAFSNTLVQEAGVDESDLLKTDGTYLYALAAQPGAGAQLKVYQLGGSANLVQLPTLVLPADGATSVDTDGMLLSDDARSLAVLTRAWAPVPEGDVCAGGCVSPGMPIGGTPVWMQSSVGIQRVDVSDPAAAAPGERLSIQGTLVDSRRIGDALYVVTVHTPQLAVDTLPPSATEAEREAMIGQLTAADVLPKVRSNAGAAQQLVAETDCYLQPANASLALQITTITVFDLASPALAHSSRCFVGGAEAIYMSTSNLYLATTRWPYATGGPLIYPEPIRTDIHKFALDASGVVYRGTADVPGHLGWDAQRKSYRLSEFNGDLRVITFTGSTGWATLADASSATAPPPSPATLTVLREQPDHTLQVLSTLPNDRHPAALGKPGEQVYAVRFIDARAYLVTFRTIDPLYVLDLSDPADPRVAGELVTPGFSDDLYALPGGLLFGVGKDVDASGRVSGLKAALFDVADPSQPRELSSLRMGEAGSSSALDFSRHGLNLLVKDGVARIALPVSLTSAPYGAWVQGLQRFEVDTRSRSLQSAPMLGAAGAAPDGDLGSQRSLQIDDLVVYLSGGSLTGYAW
jgi:hypothetical protein